MKLKYIAAVCAALGSSAVMAAPLATNTGAPSNLVTIYIAGASAQAQAVDAVLPTATFFAAPLDVVKISGGSTNSAYYGTASAALGGSPLLIIYRNSNGSGSGVRQLLAKGATIAAKNANIAAIPNTDNTNLVNLAGTCGAVGGVAGAYTATCTAGFQTLPPDVALSDVNPRELAGTFPSAGPNYYATTALATVKNALQGFGIAVNQKAYDALQAQNIAEGILPASCTPPNATIGCQPSIRKDDYASLISAEGSIKDSGTLFNGAAAADEITVCRRSDLSGTQASSNLHFLNNVCGNLGYTGSYNPLGAGDSAPTQIVYYEGSSTGNAKACLNATVANTPSAASTAVGYRLGILSLENVPAGADTYKFVKIDGVSPNNTYNGAAIVADGKQRQQFANGNYPYAYEMYAMTQPGSSAATFAGLLNTKLGDSTASDLVGIAYFDLPGTWVNNSLTNKQTRVTRAGNNCGLLLP
jgi:hypothetical protein